MCFRPVLSNLGAPDTKEARRLLTFTPVGCSAEEPQGSQSKTQGRVNPSVSHCSISRTREEKGLKVSVVSDVTGSHEAEPRRDKKWVRSGDLKHV